MGAMTLGELEALAKRFGAAVQTIKEAQVFLGGPIISRDGQQPSAEVQRGPPPPQLNAAELAQREQLLRQFKHDGLPEAIKKLEET